MKYSIYFFEGDMKNRELRRALVMEALSAYCLSHGIDFDAAKAEIITGEKGKPYIAGNPVFFNVSHSGTMWMCIVGPEQCGLDLQQEKECDYEKISSRHFRPREQEYVKQHGLAGFFRIWTRREAYGKYTGEGFYMAEMPPFADDEGLLPEYTGGAYLREIPIAEDIFCVYCTGGIDDEIEFFG